MTMRYSKPPTQRQLRVSQSIKRILSEVFIKESVCPPGGGIFTIVEVRISPDLSLATAFVSVIGSKNDPKTLSDYLENRSSMLRSILGQTMVCRKVQSLTL